MKDSKVLDKVAMVFGQMNEPPGARLRVALSGLTMAEHFRDAEGKDVLLFIDNIFRFTQAGSEGFCIARTYSFCGRLSTNSSNRNGKFTRTHYFNRKRICYFCASCLMYLQTTLLTLLQLLLSLTWTRLWYLTVH